MYNACRAAATGTEYKTFDDHAAAVAWVDERESGSIEEWATGVLVWAKAPRPTWV